MKVISKDNYPKICDAKGCNEQSFVKISFYGEETDLCLCKKCFKKLADEIGAAKKEKNKNVCQ